MANLQRLRLFTLCERYRHGSYRDELLEIEQECNRRDAERAALRAEVEQLRSESTLQHNIIQAALDFTSSCEAGEEDVRSLEKAVGDWCQAQIDKMAADATKV